MLSSSNLAFLFCVVYAAKGQLVHLSPTSAAKSANGDRGGRSEQDMSNSISQNDNSSHIIQFVQNEHLDVFVPTLSVWQSQLNNIIARGVLQFGIELDRTQTSDNIVFSPLSIVVALALVLLGAGGETHTEVATLLGLTAGVDLSGPRATLFHQHLGRQLALLLARPGIDKGTEANLASALFLQNDFPISRQFVKLSNEAYRSNVVGLDFKAHGEDAQAAINEWVSRETRGKIATFMSEPPSSDTRIIIGSAIYFNGAWENPFPQATTMRRPFYVNGDRKSKTADVIDVSLMMNSADLPYASDPDLGCAILGLPYKGNEAIMYLVLPDRMGHQALRDLEANLSAPVLERLIALTNVTPVIFAIPRMTLESTLNLKEPLSQMGVSALFDPSRANLSAIADDQGLENATSPDLYVDSVLHKVRVEVTETGTVAAAVTALSISRDGSRPVFRADHPFLFFIQHRPTKLVMFWGSVMRPTPHSGLSAKKKPQP